MIGDDITRLMRDRDEAIADVEHYRRGLLLYQKLYHGMGHRHFCFGSLACDWCEWQREEEKRSSEAERFHVAMRKALEDD